MLIWKGFPMNIGHRIKRNNLKRKLTDCCFNSFYFSKVWVFFYFWKIFFALSTGKSIENKPSSSNFWIGIHQWRQNICIRFQNRTTLTDCKSFNRSEKLCKILSSVKRKWSEKLISLSNEYFENNIPALI